MRLIVVLSIWTALFSTVLPLALTEAQAREEMRLRIGTAARVATISTSTTAWVRQVGFDSTNCAKPFTPLGSGSSWEVALSAVPYNAVQGAYSGVIVLRARAWDNTGVEKFEWLLDGAPFLSHQPPTPEQNLNVSISWDTRNTPSGIHVLCARVYDGASNMGASEAMLISIDQNKPTIAPELWLASNVGAPIVTK